MNCKFELGERVKVQMAGDKFFNGQTGRLEKIERTSNQGYWITYCTVRLDMGQPIKVLESDLISIETINKDAEVLPEYVPPIPEPKDGDHISMHEGHEIVTASAGGEAYKYCRTCKVEVKEGPRVFTGRNATLKIDGKEVGKFGEVTISSEVPKFPEPLQGYELSKFALVNFGVDRNWGETDDQFRKRLLEMMQGTKTGRF